LPLLRSRMQMLQKLCNARVADRPRSVAAPMTLNACSSRMLTYRHRVPLSTAISGTIETPMPAPTIAQQLENCPLSNTICGCTRARSQARYRRVAKAVPSRSSKNGSACKSFSASETPRGQACVRRQRRKQPLR